MREIGGSRWICLLQGTCHSGWICLLTWLIVVGSLFFTGCGAAQTQVTEYMVLIGEGPECIEQVSDVEVLVIDAEYFTAEEIAQLKAKNVQKVYTYLNIGSVEDFRDYYEDYEQYALGEYENWPGEKWIDVSIRQWQELVSDRSEELASKGIDGFFVDNTDVYYVYPSDEIYEGIVDILSALKQTGKSVCLNGGDSFVNRYLESGDVRAIFDAVNQESVYTEIDFSNGLFQRNTQETTDYFTDYLDRVVACGYEVYVLEYAGDEDLRNEAYSFAGEHGYTCYVADNVGLELNEGTGD